MLGYNVLFQDVDMIWNRDPLAEYFQANRTSPDIDIYMQHDGNHAEFYAPYSGNTGFYFVRNTHRSQVRYRAGLLAVLTHLPSGIT